MRSRVNRGVQALGAIIGASDALRGPRKRPPPRPLFDEVAWRKVVGTSIAERTRPESLKDGTLWLRVASSAWAQELSFLMSDLLARVRRSGLDVREIRFRVGDLAPENRPPTFQANLPVVAPTAPLPEQIISALDEVGDLDVRAAIANAAAHNLVWQNAHEVISAQRAAIAPRSAAGRIDPPGRTLPRDPADRRGTSGGR